MKLAVFGTGKTGSQLLELDSSVQATAFNTKNPIEGADLDDFDVLIAFVPAQVFMDNFDFLKASSIPVVTGATGELDFQYIDSELKKLKRSWIWGSNFSLGMACVKNMIKKLGQLAALDNSTSFHIHEIHHKNKIDGPSGTAKSWHQWLGQDAELSFSREGDVVGYHQISAKGKFEEISLTHNAKDRKLFARGALWAAKFLMSNKLEYGLHEFQTVLNGVLNE